MGDEWGQKYKIWLLCGNREMFKFTHVFVSLCFRSRCSWYWSDEFNVRCSISDLSSLVKEIIQISDMLFLLDFFVLLIRFLKS